MSATQNFTQDMASMGRYGDSMMAHVTPGDVVIPRDIIFENPDFLSKLKKAMEKYGADYRTHIVGSGYESRNPDTAAPEFGFGKFFPNFFKVAIPATIGAFLGGPQGALAGAQIGGGLSAFSSSGSQGPSQAPSTSIAPPTFTPSRPDAMTRPESLNSSLGGLDSIQERSSLATRGTSGGGLGGDERNYYLNLLQRNLIDEGGNVGSTDSLLPVERQYLNNSGYDSGDSMKFLKSIQGGV